MRDILGALALLEAVAQCLDVRLEGGHVHLGDPLILRRNRLRQVGHRRDAGGHAPPQLRRDAAVQARGRSSEEGAASLAVQHHHQQRGSQMQHGKSGRADFGRLSTTRSPSGAISSGPPRKRTWRPKLGNLGHHAMLESKARNLLGGVRL
jgi:hypothetical protein